MNPFVRRGSFNLKDVKKYKAHKHLPFTSEADARF